MYNKIQNKLSNIPKINRGEKHETKTEINLWVLILIKPKRKRFLPYPYHEKSWYLSDGTLQKYLSCYHSWMLPWTIKCRCYIHCITTLPPFSKHKTCLQVQTMFQTKPHKCLTFMHAPMNNRKQVLVIYGTMPLKCKHILKPNHISG